MSFWLFADIVLLLAMVPGVLLLLRASGVGDWGVAVLMSRLIAALGLFMWAQAMKNPSFCDLAVTLSLLAFPAGLMLARFFARWFLH